MTKLLTFVLLIFSTALFAQNIELKGKWFKKQEVSCETAFEDVHVVSSNETWDFTSPGKIKLSLLSNSGSSSATYKFKLNGKELSTEFWKYEIESISEKEMILKENTETGCRKLRFVSEAMMHDEQLKKYTLSGTDTLYMPMLGMFPQVKNIEDFKSHIQSEMLQKFITDGLNCKLSYRFILTKEGEISNLKIKTCNEKTEKYLAKLIQKTEEKWTPMKIHGRAVDAFIQTKFSMNASTIIKLPRN